MKYILTFGFYGKEWASMSGSTTYKKQGEPVHSIEFALKELNLEGAECRVEVDMGLVWQGAVKKQKQEIRKLWKGIKGHTWKWPELKAKLEKLLELGHGLLPLIFDIRCKNIHIRVVDGEHTLLVIGDDPAVLEKLRKKVERESRISPYGSVGNPPTLKPFSEKISQPSNRSRTQKRLRISA
ncbi:hypothetical protein J4464_06330 [Candidatus Woesearchaeota archaeon]|nr:hypothetical protein [Candidatus Woesearchaeota archaeon]